MFSREVLIAPLTFYDPGTVHLFAQLLGVYLLVIGDNHYTNVSKFTTIHGHCPGFCTGMKRKEIAKNERRVSDIHRVSDRALLT